MLGTIDSKSLGFKGNLSSAEKQSQLTTPYSPHQPIFPHQPISSSSSSSSRHPSFPNIPSQFASLINLIVIALLLAILPCYFKSTFFTTSITSPIFRPLIAQIHLLWLPALNKPTSIRLLFHLEIIVLWVSTAAASGFDLPENSSHLKRICSSLSSCSHLPLST